MTGEELARYVMRRLGMGSTPDDDLPPEAIYDYCTEARDEVRRRASMAAPRLFLTTIALEAGSGTREYQVPAATKDPIAVEAVRVTPSLARLEPSSSLEQDGGDYVWRSPRLLVIAEHVDIGTGLELEAVVDVAAVTSATTEAEIGVPTAFHRAIGKMAAVLAMTQDDRSDAAVQLRLYEREMEQLEDRFASFDGQAGGELRQALLSSYGRQYGDAIY
ncbi:MAG: hypothetical protein AB7N73_14495 [Gemmatimonadales bacterium]